MITIGVGTNRRVKPVVSPFFQYIYNLWLPYGLSLYIYDLARRHNLLSCGGLALSVYFVFESSIGLMSLIPYCSSTAMCSFVAG